MQPLNWDIVLVFYLVIKTFHHTAPTVIEHTLCCTCIAIISKHMLQTDTGGVRQPSDTNVVAKKKKHLQPYMNVARCYSVDVLFNNSNIAYFFK